MKGPRLKGGLYRCENRTRGTMVADKVRRADTYFSRLLGLLPKSGLAPGEGLWISPCREIHSFGMRFIFDAAFLDDEGYVIRAVQRMAPMRLILPVKGATSVLELGPGTLSDSQTRVGDQLVWTPVV